MVYYWYKHYDSSLAVSAPFLLNILFYFQKNQEKSGKKKQKKYSL
jgi:hypothetical protein